MAIPEGQKSGGIEAGTANRVVEPLWRFVARRCSPIASFNAAGEGPAFYCVHPIFGDVTSFTGLARSLGTGQRFYGIQVPREKMNAAFATSIEAVARHHVEALLAFQKDGTFILGGWSAGAIIALEMAQQMRARGRIVALLVALDGAPCNTGAGISRWHPLYSWKLARNLPGWIRSQMRREASWPALAKRVVLKLALRARMDVRAFRSEQTLDGSEIEDILGSTGWQKEKTQFIFALYDAMRAYVPGPYAGPTIVYEARTQPLDHLRQVGAAWTRIAENSEIVVLEGSHDDIFKEPVVNILTRHLRMRFAELHQNGDQPAEPHLSRSKPARPTPTASRAPF